MRAAIQPCQALRRTTDMRPIPKINYVARNAPDRSGLRRELVRAPPAMPAGRLRKTRHRGRSLVEWFFVLTATAYNLVRIPKILAATG